MYRLANQIKHDFYGNRIIMFAPLYLSNHGINSCVYCPYHSQNKNIARKKLSQEEVARKVIALQGMGHKCLALAEGEHPTMNPIEYILDCINTSYSIKHKNGAIRRINVSPSAATETQSGSEPFGAGVEHGSQRQCARCAQGPWGICLH